MPLRVLDDSGAGSTQMVVDAIDYAIMQGAHIINLSLGGAQEDPNLSRALFECEQEGVLVIVAAGNNGRDLQVGLGVVLGSELRHCRSISVDKLPAAMLTINS